MADAKVIESVRNYLRALEAEQFPVSFGVLFGSYARGQANQWSDIDLVVVSPRFDQPQSREDRFKLWYAAGTVNNRIEPIACGVEQWRDDQTSIIIEVARREGIVIEPAHELVIR